MSQKLLIIFFALFIIAKSNANEIETISNLSTISIVEEQEEMEEPENYTLSTKKGCFAGCMKTTCTKENLQLGGEIVEQVVDIIKDIYDIVK